MFSCNNYVYRKKEENPIAWSRIDQIYLNSTWAALYSETVYQDSKTVIYYLNELSRGLEVLKTGDIVLLYFTTTQVYYSRNRFSVNDIAITISLNRDRVGVIAF